MFRIAWRSKITGSTGHGDYRLSFQDGTSIIKELNKEYDYIEHWLELEPMKDNLSDQKCSEETSTK